MISEKILLCHLGQQSGPESRFKDKFIQIEKICLNNVLCRSTDMYYKYSGTCQVRETIFSLSTVKVLFLNAFLIKRLVIHFKIMCVLRAAYVEYFLK